MNIQTMADNHGRKDAGRTPVVLPPEFDEMLADVVADIKERRQKKVEWAAWMRERMGWPPKGDGGCQFEDIAGLHGEYWKTS